MSGRRSRILLVAASVVLLGLLVQPRRAEAVYSCGGVNDSCSCGGSNFCICCNWGSGLSGNCVWYAWHMACCNWGDNLPWCTNANTWDNYASSNGYPVCSNPAKNRIFVCESYTTYCGTGQYGHVGWVDVAYANGSIDVREQGCNGWNGVRTRHWDAQYASPAVHYINRMGGGCGTCECTPGQSQSKSCGNCGTTTRTCQSNCQWGGWSSCSGQGVCSPGASQSRGCCDCGTQSRSCTSSCAWGSWSGCAGPDPNGGSEVCDTGEVGLCAEGRVRCVDGCRSCARVYDPVAEVCDGIDNDCNAEVDDGAPPIVGETRPEFAAELRDFSFPQRLEDGARGEVWASFVNVGSETWPARGIWLAPVIAAEGTASQLYDEATWESWNVASVLDEDVPPGETAVLRFSVATGADATGTVAERFRLQDPTGSFLACPTPEVEVRLTVEPDEGHQGAPGIGGGGDEPALHGGCSAGNENGTGGAGWLFSLLAAVFWLCRSRRALPVPLS